MFQTLKIRIICIAILCKLLINAIRISCYFTDLLELGASDFLVSLTFRFWLKLQRNVNFLLLQKNFISLIFAPEIKIKTTMRYIKTVTVTPLNADGTISTLMATGYDNKDWKNAISTGYFPAPMVVEVWEAEDGEIAEAGIDEFIKYMKCGRYRGEHIANAARPKILQALRELQHNQFLRLRRLTAKEYLALMDVTAADAQKMQSVNNSTQLYKQGGNSICVNVIKKIFKSFFIH